MELIAPTECPVTVLRWNGLTATVEADAWLRSGADLIPRLTCDRQGHSRSDVPTRSNSKRRGAHSDAPSKRSNRKQGQGVRSVRSGDRCTDNVAWTSNEATGRLTGAMRQRSN
jgi:hypothetical protein